MDPPLATPLAWKQAPADEWGTARSLWTPFESHFLERGYELFVTGEGLECRYVPPDRQKNRAPDPFHAWVEAPAPQRVRYLCHSKRHIPAVRKQDGVHVMIHLIAKGEDGATHLEALRRLSRALPNDHTSARILPVLEEIAVEDTVFAVEPLVADEDAMSPWFHNVGEALRLAEQVLEGFAFIHAHNIAHRDIGLSDILSNYGASGGCRILRAASDDPSVPFRSRFRCQYYIIDFELADVFPEEMPMEECRSQGFVLEKLGLPPEKYGKERPPETLQSEPFNPFAADVYQIGVIFATYLLYLKVAAPRIFSIFERMRDEEPQRRPTANQALADFRDAAAIISEDERSAPLDAPGIFWGLKPSHLRTDEEKEEVAQALEEVDERIRQCREREERAIDVSAANSEAKSEAL